MFGDSSHGADEKLAAGQQKKAAIRLKPLWNADDTKLHSEPDSDDDSTNGGKKKKQGLSEILTRILDVVFCRYRLLDQERSISFGMAPLQERKYVTMDPPKFPPNVVRNQKYSLITFFPVFLFDQFKYFFNLYYLLVCVTQFFPILQIGFLFTYVAPLAFVISVTMVKEAYEDFKRFLRDKEANSAQYEILTATGTMHVPSSKLRVGDFVILRSNQRVPADMVLVRTHDKSASVFIRTDQLDGETDWKLRKAIMLCQKLKSDDLLMQMEAVLAVEAPHKEIYSFAGSFTMHSSSSASEKKDDQIESLNLENTLWSNTVIASGTVIGCVIYTGAETRSVINASTPKQKFGALDKELNDFSKVLFLIMVLIAFLLTSGKGFKGIWYIYFFRFILLLSAIIPISMRVNLDLGKMLYAILIMVDKKIKGTVVRTSTIPEELGRVHYLFSDKTGTLTRNVMTFHTLQMEPPLIFNRDSQPKLRELLALAFHPPLSVAGTSSPTVQAAKTEMQATAKAVTSIIEEADAAAATDDDDGENKVKYNNEFDAPGRAFGASEDPIPVNEEEDEKEAIVPTLSTRNAEIAPATSEAAQVVRKVITAIALCHNVTPVADAADEKSEHKSISPSTPPNESSDHENLLGNNNVHAKEGEHKEEAIAETNYQASSPDEIALVRFTESVGLKLQARDEKTMALLTPIKTLERYTILNIFPFTSESKRMGIIVRNDETGHITFILKGAESIMKQFIEPSDWLEEEVDNLARVGLRTLVIASRDLSEAEYSKFEGLYNTAKAVIKNRDSQVRSVVSTLEKDLILLGLTGVEDQLQEHVRQTLETLRNAGIKVWMLTGDKAETATCIGRSARLIDRTQEVFPLIVRTKGEAEAQLFKFSTKTDAALVIDGPSLEICLQNFEHELLELACQAPAVICCRCSPTQKAQMVSLMRTTTKKRVCAIGDGGNDVNMIQTADVGIGIVGKEGKQASLAADFSVLQFSFIQRLLLWHGRNSYKRSSRLSQFVIHRGLIISVIQAVFSFMFYFAAIPIYNGWLLVGYATFYTMFPVFSLVLDEDVDERTVFLFPELYKELQKGRPLSLKTFLTWIWISIYQGCMIMILCIVLFQDDFLNIIGITFTALILNELLNVALEIHRWHFLMVLSELFSIAAYITSVFVLTTYFDVAFIFTWDFWWKVSVLTATSCLPPAIVKWMYKIYFPPIFAKVNQRSSFDMFANNSDD